MANKVLVIEDEEDIRELIRDSLEDEDFIVKDSSSSTDAFNILNKWIPDAIILDIWLQGSELDGIGILEILVKNYPLIPVIMISGHGNIELAVNAIKLGAYDYLEKPFKEERLVLLLNRALKQKRVFEENLEYRSKITNIDELIGSSKQVINIRNTIKKIAKTNSRVLIKAPFGSGSRLVAKNIHLSSKRSQEPFVIFDAALKSKEDIAIGLFGSIRSDVFSYKPQKIGAFELANNGTIFIDNIDSVDIDNQTKILNLIKYNKLSQVGSNLKSDVDIRIIASTSANLVQKIKNKEFLDELYYRINIINIEIPKLSDRSEDIPLLCNYFLEQMSQKNNLKTFSITPAAIQKLQDFDWQGNIRQLKNVMELVTINAQNMHSSIIDIDMLPTEIIKNIVSDDSEDFLANITDLPLKLAREKFEQLYITKQLKKANGNITKLSKLVGMERTALHRKIKSLRLYEDC